MYEQREEKRQPQYDKLGRVIATPGLHLKSSAWVVKSEPSEGRYYFHNKTMKKNVRALDPSVLGISPPNFEYRVHLPKIKTGSSAVQAKPKAEVNWLKPSATTKTESGRFSPQLPLRTNYLIRAKSRSMSMPNILSGELEKTSPRKNRISVDSLVVLSGLGRGGFAEVVRVKDMETGGTFAMKVVEKKRLKSESSPERLWVELRTMTEMAFSPFVPRCHAAFESPTSIFFVMDDILGNDLFYHWKNRGWKFPENECRVILAELTLALEHVHEHGYIHKDVKVENVMLDQHGHVKLIDFGLAEIMRAEVGPIECTGSDIYMAPELIRDGKGGRHTDWWAFGVLAHGLLTGSMPWTSLTDTCVIRSDILGLSLEFPAFLSPPAEEFLSALLERNYSNRLGTKSDQDIKNAEFFEGVDWEATARLEAPPAFVPQKFKVNIETMNETAKQKALAGYLSLPALHDNGEASWSMGVAQILQHPLFRDSEATGLPPLGNRGTAIRQVATI